MKLEVEHNAEHGVVPIEGGVSTCTTTTTCRGTTTSTTVSN
ncbi:hypothetical protein [Natronocalculus amylovorans]|nr:hypothetical protein [Natronocalculus amylovorans]